MSARRVADQLLKLIAGIALQLRFDRRKVIPQHLAQAVEGIEFERVENVDFAAARGSQANGALEA